MSAKRPKPPPVQQQTSSQNQSVITSSIGWSGPLPPPAALREFEQILPGAAKAILDMAQAEQEHRHQQDDTATAAARSEVSRGQWLGFTITIASIVGAGYLGAVGAPWPAIVALVGVPLMAAIRAVIEARSRAKRS
jgi:uncharacterized membrane protein